MHCIDEVAEPSKNATRLFIGTHAAVSNLSVLTRDPKPYKSYFAKLQVIAPRTHQSQKISGRRIPQPKGVVAQRLCKPRVPLGQALPLLEAVYKQVAAHAGGTSAVGAKHPHGQKVWIAKLLLGGPALGALQHLSGGWPAQHGSIR
jgi:hypothetical protein